MCLYEYDEEKHIEIERREHYERSLADRIAQCELSGEPLSYIEDLILL